MLRGENIVVFSDDWGRHPSSCQHLIRQLLPENRVLWVNTIGMRSPQLSLVDLRRSVEVVGRWITQPEAVDEPLPANLTVAAPLIVPFNHLPLVRPVNAASIRRAITRAMAANGMTNPIVITTFPCTSDWVGLFGEKLHVYYCVDDFTNWPGVKEELIRGMEEDLLVRADLVVASSDELCRSKTRNGRVPGLLAHGVDVDHFRQTVAGARELAVTKPVIGFFGAISPWLDFTIIGDIARAHPEWSVVLVGPVDADRSLLPELPNLHLPGPVPYAELPGIARQFDVGIIPFEVSDLTAAVNPLKLLEYLCCGLPVVSTYMPAVAAFGDTVTIAGRSGFVAAIERELSLDCPARRQARMEVAARHSWRAVADRFSTLATEAMSAAA